ncbi:HAMP domain-containing histidine kinase [Salinirubellus salinus]|uniref:histidine kinase n=1 Tax=Salinirubellus salinus TaxID=1364945 RepID=A0A9E7R751_9EURY|nr:HAMP domain-containing sensor histidine kinase [Salinirubellus salinus]UWM56711.1 HAMP domain-containing histidine kinase [Salinirubellus salinus]
MDPPSSSFDHSIAEVVQALPVIACLVGPDGEVLVTNESWRAFGETDDNPHPASEGENYLEVCHRAADDPYATEVVEALERLLAGEMEEYRTTYPHTGPEGPRWFDLLAYRLELDGDPHVLVFHLDSTSQTQAELATTAEVERLEALARVLSHDLRTPLSVASGYITLLEDEVDSGYLEHVQAALNRIATIAENAVLIARGRDVEDPDELPLDDIAWSAWGSVAPDDASLSVTDDLTVQANRGLLTELLENLFRNALDHAGEEPTVLVGPLEDGSGFYVADDGPGIAPEVRDEVFDIGYTTGTGTGFGLDIVRRIADAHGWDVQAEESDEGGARFELRTATARDD